MAKQVRGFIKAISDKNGYISLNVVQGKNEAWYGGFGKGSKDNVVVDGVTLRKGLTVEFSSETNGRGYEQYVSGTMKEVKQAPKASGGATGGKSGYVDNTIGMAVGAAANAALQLYAAGKIGEADVPLAVMNHYKLAEYAKKLAAKGEIDKLAELQGRFGYTVGGTTNTTGAPPAKQAQKAPPAPVEPPEEEEPPFDPFEGEDGVPEEDSIPF